MSHPIFPNPLKQLMRDDIRFESYGLMVDMADFPYGDSVELGDSFSSVSLKQIFTKN